MLSLRQLTRYFISFVATTCQRKVKTNRFSFVQYNFTFRDYIESRTFASAALRMFAKMDFKCGAHFTKHILL